MKTLLISLTKSGHLEIKSAGIVHEPLDMKSCTLADRELCRCLGILNNWPREPFISPKRNIFPITKLPSHIIQNSMYAMFQTWLYGGSDMIKEEICF